MSDHHIHLDQTKGVPAVCHHRQVSGESDWHPGRSLRESVWLVLSRGFDSPQC